MAIKPYTGGYYNKTLPKLREAGIIRRIINSKVEVTIHIISTTDIAEQFRLLETIPAGYILESVTFIPSKNTGEEFAADVTVSISLDTAEILPAGVIALSISDSQDTQFNIYVEEAKPLTLTFSGSSATGAGIVKVKKVKKI